MSIEPRIFLLALLLIGSTVDGFSQDGKKWSLNGYVKYMQTDFIATSGNQLALLTDNLIHNRLNFNWYTNKYITTKIEMRNRAFYGEYTKLIPGYGDILERDLGFFDLSWTLVNNHSFVLHSTIDRAFVNYEREKYNLRLGRQRVNWGLNTVFTPNDVFNAFNYFDFDYEERPGVDAVRFQYFTSSLADLDIAIAPVDSAGNWVAAAKYGFNHGSYDLQVIGSWYREDLMAGIGWAGNLKNAGLKGEASYFHPREDLSDTSGVFTGTFTVDYTFGNGIYASGALLYVSDGTTEPITAGGTVNLLDNNISVKRLMPTKYTAMVMVSKSLNPATSLSVLTMYAPGTNLLIVFPTLTYSIKENWDADVVLQSSFMEAQKKMAHGGSAAFLRLKRSF